MSRSTTWSRRRSSRARRHWPNVIFMLDAEPVTVRGVPSRLDRAIANLLDNAGKFSPAGSVVDTSRPGGRGADRRRPRARACPRRRSSSSSTGSTAPMRRGRCRAQGSGLAIVKQVVDGHHGTVTLSNRSGGGTVVQVTLTPLSDRALGHAAGRRGRGRRHASRFPSGWPSISPRAPIGSEGCRGCAWTSTARSWSRSSCCCWCSSLARQFPR